jgi:hypothetical protein
MLVYYFLLYKVYRVMLLSRRRLRFWRRESLTEATASTMVVVWSNWLFVGMLMMPEIPYLGNSPKSTTTQLCMVSSGLTGCAFIYWLHKHLLKSTRYRTYASTFPTYSYPKTLLLNLLSMSLLLSLYISPWVASKWLLN